MWKRSRGHFARCEVHAGIRDGVILHPLGSVRCGLEFTAAVDATGNDLTGIYTVNGVCEYERVLPVQCMMSLMMKNKETYYLLLQS